MRLVCRNHSAFRLFPILILILSLNLFVYAQEPYDYQPADYQQFKNLKANEVTILPDRFLRAYDPLTIFFTQDVHPTGSGPEDYPEKLLQMTPQHPGEYRWLDARSLEFRPTIPWPPMEEFSIKVGEERKKLMTLLSPPGNIYPENGAENLSPVDRVGLEFAQYIDPQVLENLVSFEACPLPGIGRKDCQTFTHSDYRIKVAERTSESENYQYWFVMQQPFGLGLKVRTYVRLSDDASLAEAIRTYSFNTKEEFRLRTAGTRQHQFTINPEGSRYTEEQSIRLSREGELIFEFTAAPAELSLSQVKSLVMLSPAPHALDFRQTQQRLIVNLTVDAQKLYKVSLQPIPLQDEEGRQLVMDGVSEFYFYQPEERHFVRWKRSFGILERHGPQHFPIQTAGLKNIDLRIYRIDPLHKAFWPFPNTPVSVNEEQRPPGPGEEPTPEDEIVYPLHSGQMATHIQMLGSPHYSEIIDLSREGALRHGSFDLKDKLEQISGAKRPGTYLAGIRQLDGSSERQYIKIQVTDLCLSTVESKDGVLFAVSSYKTGQPVDGASIRIEGVTHQNRKRRFETIVSGTTDQQGFFKLEHDQSMRRKWRGFQSKRVTVNKGDDFLVIDTRPGQAPPQFADNHWYGNRGGWLQWFANHPYDVSAERTIKAFLFTERPIYRPEEKVYLKGYTRSRFQGKLSYVNNDSFFVKIRSPAGAEWDFPIELTSNGSFDLSFQEEDLPTGVYRAQLIKGVAGMGQVLASRNFSMEAYRIPRFEVQLHGPDRVPNDRPFKMRLTATYYAGGKVVDRPVEWRVTPFPYSYQPEGLEGYYLSSDRRYGSSAFDSQTGVIEENQQTDENGEASITVNPQKELDGRPRKYICEATVTGADQQTVSNSRSVIALPPFTLGLKTERHITAGNTIAAEIVAIDVDEEFSAGQEVTVQLKKMSWISYLQETDFARTKPKYVTNETVKLVSEKKGITAANPVSVQFPEQEPGVYILEISARDKLGRRQSVKVDLFLAGDKPIAWEKPQQRVFETVPDQTSYEPGETATILLKSPYQNGMVLTAIETPDGRPLYKWIDVHNGQATLSIDIEPTMVPRMPVSFLLMRPRIAKPKTLPEGQKVDLGKPETVANTTWLNVEPVNHRVYVDLNHPQMVLPGEQMTLQINLTDANEQPVPGEVTLWLVDEAVLALKEEQRLDPLDDFIDPVTSQVTIRDTRNWAIGDLRVTENAGGGGVEDEMAVEGLGKITVRKTFKTVPYYNPRIMVDASGKAQVHIDIPDNLTNFAIRAVAVSGADRFGFSKSKVAVRLPVIVQPALPRFARIGDKFSAGGVARVVEGEGGSGRYSIETTGADLVTPAGEKVNKWEGSIDFPQQKALPLNMPMQVSAPGYDENGELRLDSITVRMAVQRTADKAGDAFEVSIPLLMDRQPEKTATFAELTPDSAFKWEALPEAYRPNTLNRELLVSDQLSILKVLAGLRFLMNYPHGCTEQRVSYAYPSLAYIDIWKEMGLESPDPDLKKYVQRTLEFLAKVQKPDGLFSYWPGSKGYVYLTAYIVEFLLEVEKANQQDGVQYPFDKDMLDRALKALERSLRSDYDQFLSGYKYYERSAALYALTLAGKAETSYLRELATQIRQVDVLSQSRIYLAIYKSDAELDKLRNDLAQRLWDYTIFKLQKGRKVFAGLQEREMRIGAEVHASEITNLAGLIRAFSKSGQSPDKLRMMVDELIILGSVDGWGHTNVNSAALLAFRDFLAKSKREAVRADFNLQLDDKTKLLTYDGSKGVLKYNWQGASAGSLGLRGQSENPQFYVKYTQSYLPQSLSSAAEAQQRGFVVKRELIRVPEGDAPRTKTPIEQPNKTFTFQMGDILEEHIQVVNPERRHFVAVSAPFAAGFELLNPNLNIASADANPTGQTTDAGDYQAYLDDKVIFYFDEMSAGSYDFYYRLKATTAGDFTHPPAEAEKMYQLEVRGNSHGARMVIEGE